MTNPQQWDNLIGLTATDADGGKIGNVGQVYLDERNGQPAWVTMSTGLFGTAENFAPFYGASVRGDQLVLAVSKRLVKDAPNIEDDGHLSEAEVAALYQHYAAYLGSADANSGAQGADRRTRRGVRRCGNRALILRPACATGVSASRVACPHGAATPPAFR
jgi:PRC-barrel domain